MNYEEELREVNEHLERLRRENEELKRQRRVIDLLKLQIQLLLTTESQESKNFFEGIRLGLGQSANDLVEQQEQIVDAFRKAMLLAGA